MTESDREFRAQFWDTICEYGDYLKVAVAINAVLAILALASLPWISRGSTSFVIVVLDLVILGPLLLVTGYLVWRCRRHEPPRRF